VLYTPVFVKFYKSPALDRPVFQKRKLNELSVKYQNYFSHIFPGKPVFAFASGMHADERLIPSAISKR